jgi:hypothetical protein
MARKKGPRFQHADLSLWTLDVGPWILDFGLRSFDHPGFPAVDQFVQISGT